MRIMRASTMKASTLPILLKNPTILLIGGGKVALQKAQVLHENKIDFRIIAEVCLDEMFMLCSNICVKAFDISDLNEEIVIDATGNMEVTNQLLAYKKEHKLLLNVVDVPSLCDFYFMALTKNRPLQIAVSSNGSSPTAAQYFRDECEALIPKNISEYLEKKQQQRDNNMINIEETNQELVRLKSKVYLVGCGLGDPDLLTIKAYKIIQTADVVLHDNLISDEIMALVPQTTTKVYVGKKKGHHSKSQHDIHETILEYTSKGLTVARLKSGDPFIFGRGAEELLFLNEHQIPCEVIPGISSAVSAPLVAGIPITARDFASSFSVVSPHSKGHSLNLTWIDLLHKKNHTVVVLMGLSRIPEILVEAKKQNVPTALPCAIISNASRPNQKVATCTLETLEEASQEMIRPSILVFGDVVNAFLA
ncbi:MAG: Uroporphyrinogen-III methyltransferase (EC [uncultured Sulfurovum sp.]|uniref:Uroporphyrinogen-III methyltransferase (EC) n=1 Tax=uncultured Sulfurovum sp. TaxID=269237 RepID=A0A6S6SQ71_9BACT|nr:MAG: Uroporphyrinogen-III methyltransferase (EC [uncultured Sulfurovum sp.]